MAAAGPRGAIVLDECVIRGVPTRTKERERKTSGNVLEKRKRTCIATILEYSVWRLRFFSLFYSLSSSLRLLRRVPIVPMGGLSVRHQFVSLLPDDRTLGNRQKPTVRLRRGE